MTRWTVDGLEARVDGFRLGPVEFSLGEREVLAVLGPSGAGKTTFLRALAGLLPSGAGRVNDDGADRSRTPPERRGIAYVPQGLALLPDRSVLRNVAYPMELRGLDRDGAAVRELVERFGLADLRTRRPASLSTGQQQRVALARALAARPRLLLWDEPLGALDLLSRDDLIEALREVRDQDPLPVVLVTHDPTIAFSLANRFLLLEAGGQRFLGDAEGLIGAPPDAFAARFAGYENVYTTEQLGRRGDAPFARHLLARAGRHGVGLRSPAAAPAPAGAPWTARARRVAASPNGWRCEAEIDGLSVRLTLPAARSVRPGDAVGFFLDGADTVALGGAVAPT